MDTYSQLTRDDAREQIARAIVAEICVNTLDGMGGCPDSDGDCISIRPWLASTIDGEVEAVHVAPAVAADIALAVLWAEIERLRWELVETGVDLAEARAGGLAEVDRARHAGFMAGFAVSGEGYNGEMDADRGDRRDAEHAWQHYC